MSTAAYSSFTLFYKQAESGRGPSLLADAAIIISRANKRKGKLCRVSYEFVFVCPKPQPNATTEDRPLMHRLSPLLIAEAPSNPVT
jgi:hypothetical protein